MVKFASVPPGLDPVEWPTVHLLDRIADRGGLRPRTVFATVGYGVVPLFRGAPGFIPSPGRLFTTSRYKGLTQPYLKLNENTELEGNGGSCFGDSGAPRFVNGTNLAVAFTSGGGDPICRAGSDNIRLDIPEARAFFDDYLELP